MRWLALALALGLAACGPAREAAAPAATPPAVTAPAQPTETPARQVRVARAEPGTLTARRTASVRIAPAQEAQVAAAASGQVARILRREGERVAVGETVLELGRQQAELQVQNARLAVESARVNLAAARAASGEGLGQAQAGLRSAELALEAARRQLAEGQQLAAAGGLAQAELQGLEAQAAQAEATYRQAQDAVARAGRSGGEDLELLRLQVAQAENGLAQAEKALADTRVTAPFAGEVAQLFTEEGEFVGAGSPVFRLVSLDRQLARFSVPPEDAARLLQQDAINIPYGGRDFAARIVRSSEVPGASRLVEITASLDEASERIPVGAATQLTYEVVLGEGLLVPAGALQATGGEVAVFVAEDGQARRQIVRVVGEAGGQAAVEGVAAGAAVIYPLPADLRDGAAVSVLGTLEAETP